MRSFRATAEVESDFFGGLGLSVSQFQGSCLGICCVWGLNLSHRLTHYKQVAIDTEPKH